MAADLIGRRFGMLAVIGESRRFYPSGQSRVCLVCRCDCGNTKEIARCEIVSGRADCGCRKGERVWSNRARQPKVGSLEYRCWSNMKSRCENPKAKSFADYGAKGVRVCEKWRSFAGFYEDMGDAPGPRYTLDRIDNSRGYEPGNCRWATRKQQNRNKTNSRFLTFNGKTATIAEWSEETGIRQGTIWMRLNRQNLSVEDALTIKTSKAVA